MANISCIWIRKWTSSFSILSIFPNHKGTVTPPTGTTNATLNLQASMFAFALRFFKVFEYVEVNNQPGFQIGVDTVSGE